MPAGRCVFTGLVYRFVYARHMHLTNLLCSVCWEPLAWFAPLDGPHAHCYEHGVMDHGERGNPRARLDCAYAKRPRPGLSAGLRAPSALRIARLAAALALTLLVACAPEADRRPVLGSGACYAAAWTTAEAWTQLRGDLPIECFELLLTYEIQTMPEVPACQGQPAGAKSGCSWSGGEKRLIVIDSDLGEDLQRAVAVHEWTHVLARCAEGQAMGYGGGDHADQGLWGVEGGVTRRRMATDSVVGLGIALAAGGPCLEAM